MCSRLLVPTALAVLLLAGAAPAEDLEAADAPMSSASLERLQTHLDEAGARMTVELQERIERRAEPFVMASLANAHLAPPAAPDRHRTAPRARPRRAPAGCVFEADHVLSCQVIGVW